ncbi:hypothetical protein J1N35_005737 [Gossypium stocksii]|uniref:Uncharacterized protein n=1 Tax=Gossypium stocksii TaxID=47602 RepID=A0A9D3WEG3_9ROSI|nr:hypothetical protein J1N35_005737 [Gossypium stocksii]
MPIRSGSFLQPITGVVHKASFPTSTDNEEDITVRIRFADVRDIGFVDAVWISYFLYRIHVDALASLFGHGSLHCWNCFCGFHVMSFYYLLCHGPSAAAEGNSW